MRYRLWAVVAACLGVLLVTNAAVATVKPNALISENMVLQQGAKAAVWGTADNGEEVKVTFQGKSYTSPTKDGQWSVTLENLKPGGPYEMTIGGKGDPITLKNVLVGEVWVCSGQSNMEWSVLSSLNPGATLAAAANPNIRLFTVPKKIADTPQTNVESSWKECNAENLFNFSAVAYFFGRDLNKALNVPVGLINTSWGGTVAEAWASKPALEANADLNPLLGTYDKAKANYFKQLDTYLTNLDKHKEAVLKAKEASKFAPPAPQMPASPEGGPNNRPTGLFNGMIAPLLPYAIKGAIWYQGESNASRAYEYRTLFPAMIQDWRANWKQGDFPFLFVQLAPFWSGDSNGVVWPELREAQLLTTQKVPNTAMAVITDYGDEKDIHPKAKEPVGGRLALAALALGYGKKVAYSGPIYKAPARIDGSKVVLSFEHVGGGLVAKGGPLKGFTVAGEDQKFVPAEAEIVDDKVVVSSKDVVKPVAVRYGWTNYMTVNLFNKDGLPASPFRTDDFPMVTKPK